MLWKLVSAAIKDNNSLIKAKFSRKDSCRNYDLEAAIIKATSHDNYLINTRNAQITRSWVVALKGLMLMHGVLRFKVPAVQNMGRLPFEFSDFTDGHSKLSKTWSFNASKLSKTWSFNPFIRDYYTPLADNMNVGLIIEAMNCVTVEIFDVYRKIYNEIAKVLLKIHPINKLEAELALEILQKATEHAEEISLFLDFRSEYYGTPINANELPTVTQILEEDVQQKLERIANGNSDKTCRDIDLTKENFIDAIVGQIDKTKVSGMETIITDKWVVFYDNLNVNGIKSINTVAEETAGKDLNLIPFDHYEIPDLITF
ncbi:hypothetical protein ES332_A05G345900v1 [Gossypium tomentosum]|uniref:AP180 N-terminal homology (ANTH) domain-containing protein n=1 Tax=Gossypium tomentosum TaxID=34277 RepID=A0A5D2QNX9_GOSTO|nr:hypothetical protein ES332_A05G345900v1 [Gossypium tomentosum]